MSKPDYIAIRKHLHAALGKAVGQRAGTHEFLQELIKESLKDTPAEDCVHSVKVTDLGTYDNNILPSDDGCICTTLPPRFDCERHPPGHLHVDPHSWTEQHEEDRKARDAAIMLGAEQLRPNEVQIGVEYRDPRPVEYLKIDFIVTDGEKP